MDYKEKIEQDLKVFMEARKGRDVRDAFCQSIRDCYNGTAFDTQAAYESAEQAKKSAENAYTYSDAAFMSEQAASMSKEEAREYAEDSKGYRDEAEYFSLQSKPILSESLDGKCENSATSTIKGMRVDGYTKKDDSGLHYGGQRGFFDGKLLQGNWNYNTGAFESDSNNVCNANPFLDKKGDNITVKTSSSVGQIAIMVFDGSTKTDGVYQNSVNELSLTATSNGLLKFKLYDASGITPSQAPSITVTINGQYALAVDSGTNGYDKDKITRGNRLDTSGNNFADTSCFVSDYINVKGFVRLVKNSPTQDAYHRLAFYTDSKAVISTSNNNENSIPSNCSYVRFCGKNAEIDTAEIMLYTTTLIPLNAPLNDGDYLDTDEGVEYHKYGVVDLGSLSWNRLYTSSTGNFYATPLNCKPISNSSVANVYLEGYTPVSRNNILNNNMSVAVNESGNVCINNTSYTDATDFKTAMAGQFLVYELVTPTTTPLTAEQIKAIHSVPTFSPETIISNTDNAPIVVSYVMDNASAKWVDGIDGKVDEVNSGLSANASVNMSKALPQSRYYTSQSVYSTDPAVQSYLADCKNGKTYSVSLENNTNANATFFVGIFSPSMTFKSWVASGFVVSANSKKEYQYTCTEDCVIQAFTSTNTSFDNLHIQIEEGNKATDYVKYRGDSNIKITEDVSRINESLSYYGLLNKCDYVEQGSINSSGVKEDSTKFVRTNSISCASGNDITVKFSKAVGFCGIYYYNGSTFLSKIETVLSTKSDTVKYVAPSNSTSAIIVYTETLNQVITPSMISCSVYVNNAIEEIKADLTKKLDIAFNTFADNKTTVTGAVSKMNDGDMVVLNDSSNTQAVFGLAKKINSNKYIGLIVREDYISITIGLNGTVTEKRIG